MFVFILMSYCDVIINVLVYSINNTQLFFCPLSCYNTNKSRISRGNII